MSNPMQGHPPTRAEFIRVWARVAPPNSPVVLTDVPAPVERPAPFAGQILRARAAARLLGSVARCAGGAERRRLAALADDSARQARTLSAEAFLLTGDGHWAQTPLPAPRLPDDGAQALRACYLALQAVQAGYRALAEAVPDGQLGALCAALAEDTGRQLTAVRALLSRKIAGRFPW